MNREDKIRARAEAATEGPWEAITGPRGVMVHPRDEQRGPSWITTADAEFITHARADVPWLLDRLAEVRALHQPMPTTARIPACRTCEECSTLWPCATVRALEGEP